LQIDQTTLGLPTREYFLDESNLKYVEAYRVYMITIATLLGAPIVSATKDIDDIVDFETNLAKVNFEFTPEIK
jgi:neprilysin